MCVFGKVKCDPGESRHDDSRSRGDGEEGEEEDEGEEVLVEGWEWDSCWEVGVGESRREAGDIKMVLISK